MAGTPLENDITVRYRGVKPWLPKRQTNPAKKQSFLASINYWFDHFRKKHFTVAGAKEYGYQPRDGEKAGTASKHFWRSYTGRKLKKFGHRRPLMWSGDSELRTRTRKVSASSKWGRWTNSARKLNFRPHPNAPNLPDELTRVSSREIVKLAKVYEKKFGQELKRIKEETAVKIT